MAIRLFCITLLAMVCPALACQSTAEFDNDAYVLSLLGGSIGGIVIALLMVILVSLPLCCGVFKLYGKVIAGIGISLGLFALIVPLFGALGSCVPFVDYMCSERCVPCTEDDKDAAAKICATLGAFVVYIGAYGWLACVLGIVAASLGCCVCCECCRAKLDESERMRQVGGNPMAVVVGKDTE
ncbi:unnamed protein product [Durusdinium trenchii]|uniref:Uncharacterized protein n=1 Tax=Durusdinium trenchii TaxID=1381693 RepID=A0ABP0SYL1_9DINO